MIKWFIGNTGAGKTTQARFLAEKTGAILIDGDELRDATGNHDLSETGRRRQNFTAAKLAKLFNAQGHDVVIATICPYKDQREEIQKMINCEFIYLEYANDDKIPESPFERPCGL